MKVILVVESDATMRENIGEILEISGYKVEYAVDGLEGLQKVFNILPDLVVSDLNLSGIGGDLMIEALLMSPKTKDIPYILLTPSREGRKTVKNLKSGSANYLTIPFDYEQMIGAVENHLKPIPYSLRNVS